MAGLELSDDPPIPSEGAGASLGVQPTPSEGAGASLGVQPTPSEAAALVWGLARELSAVSGVPPTPLPVVA